MEDLYFKNNEARLIFGLLELKERQQLGFLDIDWKHFCDRSLAKEWYEKNNTILKKGKHELKDRALGMLYQLYKMMIA